MLNRTMIGQTLSAHETMVKRGSLRFFAKAIGETAPVYTDDPNNRCHYVEATAPHAIRLCNCVSSMPA